MGQGLFNFSANTGGNKDSNKSTNFDVSPFMSAVNTAQGEIGATLRASTQAGVARGNMVKDSFDKIGANFTAGLQLGMQEKLQRLQNCQANARLQMEKDDKEFKRQGLAFASEGISLKTALSKDPTNDDLQKKWQEFQTRTDVGASGIFADKEFQSLIAPLDIQETLGLSTKVANELNFSGLAEQISKADPTLIPTSAQILSFMQNGVLNLNGQTVYANGYDQATKTFTPSKYATNPKVQTQVLTMYEDMRAKAIAGQTTSSSLNAVGEQIKSSQQVRELRPQELAETKKMNAEIIRNNKLNNTVALMNANTGQINSEVNLQNSRNELAKNLYTDNKDILKGFRDIEAKGDNLVISRNISQEVDNESRSPHKILATAEGAAKDITALNVFKDGSGKPKNLSEKDMTTIQNLYNSSEYTSLQNAIARAAANGLSVDEAIKRWYNPKPTADNPLPKLDKDPLNPSINPRLALAVLESKRMQAIPNIQAKFKSIQQKRNLYMQNGNVEDIQRLQLLDPVINQAFNETEAMTVSGTLPQAPAQQPTKPATPAQVPLTKTGVESIFKTDKPKSGTYGFGRLTGN